MATTFDPAIGVIPGARTLFHGTDDFVAGADLMGLSAARLVRQETRTLEAAQVLTCISEPLAKRWREVSGRDVGVVPNGCDPDHYRSVLGRLDRDTLRLQPPIVLLMGMLSERIDIEILQLLVASDLSLLLVGEVSPTFADSRWHELLSHPRVLWTDYQRYEELPVYLAASDVGITPYTRSGFNTASYPLKSLEYLCAGRPVVGTVTPPDEDVTALPDFYRSEVNPSDFVDAVHDVVGLAEDPNTVDRMQSYVAKRSWSARAAQLARYAFGI